MTSAQVSNRLERMEQAILRTGRVNVRQAEDARRSLLAEVAQLAQAYSIIPTADQDKVMRELDRALRELCDRRHGGRAC